MKPSATFGVVFDQFCQKLNMERAGLRFTFADQRIQEDDTPESLDMAEDETNVVDVNLQQAGG
ncbi:hypothetical protein FB45DRAFT_1022245 [Roridomyces roridus]|uniref:Rad60/SUMO-like domain-containing protein n=1 Tax=Roridomyces roridus TaxID=1738132 RepID=A0AAD7C7P2_9AGAR|nr:hypothetical protein FB45DRAFT_1022245 [Roridomyces roridus]